MRPKIAATVLASVLLSTLVAGCTTDPGLGDPDAGPVTFQTNLGCFVVEFFPDDAPITVANFLRYVDEGFYSDVAFHRVVAGFVIQGGGFDVSGTKKDTHDPIPLEAKLPNARGTLSMARTNDQNSGTSQFFVNLVDNAALDKSRSNPGYAVFGKVTVGMDIIDQIGAMPVGPSPGGQAGAEWPREEAYIKSAARGDNCEQAPPPEPTYGLDVGLMHDTQAADGAWEVRVSGATDYAPAWLLNTGNQPDTFTVKIVGPAHWDISIVPTQIDLGPDGQRSGNGRYAYADHAILSLSYDQSKGTPAETDRIRVSFTSEGDPSVVTTLALAPVLGSDHPTPVSAEGDQVTVGYRGSFDNGEEFDSGSFPTTLGSGQTVPGFDYGLLGFAQGEEMTIRFPPEFGYGHDNPPGSRLAKFNSEWLNFDIDMQQLPE